MVCSKKLSIQAVAANEAFATYPVEAEEHTESHCDVPTSEEWEDVAFLWRKMTMKQLTMWFQILYASKNKIMDSNPWMEQNIEVIHVIT